MSELDDKKRWSVFGVLAGFGVLALLLIVAMLAFYVGKRCAPEPQPIVTGIDAGPGEREIAARLDAAVQRAEEQLAQIEREHAEEIAAFDDDQRAKYEALRARGPEEVSRWLIQFNRQVRGRGRDAGPR